ncbi:hypothetical protein EBB07_28370 [Paenibacillaceae bacterium]|nr:hypothetical protein EBB07_28370 [Paenibacillaceae bacterium]
MAKRIDLNKVAIWYEEADIKPIQKEYYDTETDCGCLLTAMCIGESIISKEKFSDLNSFEYEHLIIDTLISEHEFLPEYINGVIDGFDFGAYDIDLGRSENELFLKGKEDGAKAWEITTKHFKDKQLI